MTKRAFLFFLVALLWLPLIQMATGFQKSPPVEENRSLAPKPNFSIIQFDKFASGAVNWFNDHYGLRDFFIRAKTQVDFSIFGMSSRIYIGKDGWLFYKSVIDREQPAVELFLQKNADAVIDGVSLLAGELKKRNIQLVVTIGPMKNAIYGGNLSGVVESLPDNRQVTLLEHRLKAMKSIIFIDSFGLLNDAAKDRPVFHKTDFHWNDPAAYEIAKNMVNKLFEVEKNSRTFQHSLEIDVVSMSGGEAMFMPLFFPPKEDALMVRKNWIDPISIYSEKIKPFQWVYEQTPSSTNSLGPMVVLGDSFFDGMVRAGLPIHFQKIYRANWSTVQLSKLLSELPVDTRYLFIEFIEVGIGPMKQIKEIGEGGTGISYQ